jgi:hypothetical protein
MTWLAVLASFIAGVAAERARSRHAISKRETARYEFRMQLTRPLDLAPCKLTGTWQERR